MKTIITIALVVLFSTKLVVRIFVRLKAYFSEFYIKHDLRFSVKLDPGCNK